jgi:arabinan endo-1,5-alpha-L-arabinosidase
VHGGRRRHGLRAGLALAAGSALLAACGGSGSPGADGDGSAAGSSDPAAEDPAEGAVNPVLDDDFPDPDVLEVDGTYYAYATNGNARNVRVATSQDLLTWEEQDDALPQLPPWVIPGKTWAPEVTELAPGRYALYFTATNFRPTLQCIGVATADDPLGPFTVAGEAMLVCPPDEGGAIDASTFLDQDGTRYLLWKNDGNCCGLDTWLQMAPLSPDGLSLTAAPTRLVKQDQDWEGNLVEAPTLVREQDTYVLMYSANDYGGEQYAVGYATAPSATGPYTKAPEPLLDSDSLDGAFVGPGGQDVVTGPDGEDRLLFHSWYGGLTYRAMNTAALQWEPADGGVRPVVGEPTG